MCFKVWKRLLNHAVATKFKLNDSSFELKHICKEDFIRNIKGKI